jgi:hypothetical protein
MTITAKNYAAQAISGITDKTTPLNDTNNKMAANLFYADKLKKAVKFAIPDTGRLLDDNLKGLELSTIRLPYPITVVECFQISDAEHYEALYDNGIETFKRVILAYETMDDGKITRITIVPFTGINGKTMGHGNKDVWSISPIILNINFGNNENFFHCAPYSDEHFEMFRSQIGEGIGSPGHSLTTSLMDDARVFMELIEALSCKNVEQSIHQTKSPKNAQRIKSHKLPIYETKFLTIRTTQKQTSVKGSSHHSSPRQHLRRGHIRRLESGNIWVNSCVVGDSSKGIINKQYKVK